MPGLIFGYGPYGRPDMALFKWTKAMLNDLKLELYNRNHYRDFTYIDDVCEYIEKTIKKAPVKYLADF